jgi:hypothetical protein
MVMAKESKIACAGCGAGVPDLEGASHSYLGTVPGCWALAGEVFAREYSDAAYAKVHMLSVDAYAAQHQGEPERRTINSLCFHLIGLHLAIDQGMPPDVAFSARSRLRAARPEIEWLVLPETPAWMTITDVIAAGSPVQHSEIVWAWARSVCAAWSPHHQIIREWARPLLR